MKLLRWFVGIFRRMKNAVLRCLERGIGDFGRARGQHPLRGYHQLANYNCGATVARSLIEYIRGKRVRWSVLHRQLGVRPHGCTVGEMKSALARHGVRTRTTNTTKTAILRRIRRSPILTSIKGRTKNDAPHWIIVTGADADCVHIANATGIPGETRRTWTWKKFAQQRELHGMVVS